MNHPLLRHAKRSLAALAIASALTPGLACSQTLEQAVANTLDTNPAIRQAFNQFKAREEQVNQAQAGYLPTIDLTAGIGREEIDNPVSRAKGGTTSLNRGEAGVSIKQVLFDGFRTANEVDRFSREASSEQWKLYGTAENKALDTVKVYLNYLRAKQVVVLSEKNLKSHEETYDQIKQKTEYGLGSTADLSQVTGRLARARANLISAKNNLLDTESQFFRVVNQAPKDLIKPMPDTAMLPDNLKAALDEAKQNQPALHSAMNDIEAARYERKSAKSNYYPEVSLELNGGWNNNLGGTEGYANDLQAMVQMRYNLFNGGSDSARAGSLLQTGPGSGDRTEHSPRSGRRYHAGVECLRKPGTANDVPERTRHCCQTNARSL